MPLPLLGALLLAIGLAAAVALYRPPPDVPAAGWSGDPSSPGRRRWWDGQAWTPRVADGAEPPGRPRRFHGRFWGGWVWVLAAAIVVSVGGGALYLSGENVRLLAVTSFAGMALTCWAAYRFTARQIGLDDAVSPLQVIAATVAGAGSTLLVAMSLNDLVIGHWGIARAVNLVGFIEEGAKYLVPIALFLVGRYRNPRAGIGVGLGAGFGFAITETTLYAFETLAASGPNLCGTETVVTAQGVVQEQLLRIFTVSPLHWMWTATAVAIGWRLWRVYGRRGTVGALGGLLLVMVIHSFNDTTTTFGCGSPIAGFLWTVVRWGILLGSYLLFKAMLARNTPPTLVGHVSRGWTPRRLPPARPGDGGDGGER
ncbi:PrsW family glutamic-type intramembrane protease [Phytomonospora sp. NPDC050363]|uniref:PrsW family glutamic-type intramembrane protease n=1 Tax=Phytomonospora sp. NPDC050363 TaxID=3155642 RepID=UPI0034085BE1